MCRSNGVRNPVSQVRAFLLGVAVALFASVTSAQQYMPNGSPVPQNIKWVNATATGANTRATFSSLFNGVTRSHTVPVPVSSGTLGALTKGAMKRVAGPIGWYMILRDIVNGAGWVINELTQQVQTPAQPGEPLGSSVLCYSHAQNICANTGQGLATYFNGRDVHFDGGGRTDACVYQANQTVKCQFTSPQYGTYPITLSVVRTPFNTGMTNANPGTPAQDVTDTQLGDLVKARPEIINAVLVDPVTGAPIRFPELVTAMNDLRKALEAAHGTTPGQDVEIDPNYPNNPQANEGDRPPFCEWASKVCDFIDWFKQDPDNGQDPDLPYEAREPEMEEYDSGWGGGSCPAPYSVAVLDGEFEISFAGICGFVEYLRPLAIALAWISSAFIVVGSSPRRL